jgi:hypothetical protein
MSPAPLVSAAQPRVVKYHRAWIWLIGAVAVMLTGALGLGGDVAGTILLVVAVLVPGIIAVELRTDQRLGLVFMIVLAAHAGVAILNAFITTTPGSDRDAAGFHDDASRFAWTHAIDPELTGRTLHVYSRLLGYCYRYLGNSLLLGNALSVFAVALSCLVLVKIMRQMGTTQRAGTLALYGLLPSGLMFMSVTLREAYQQLFCVLAVYAALMMRGRSWRWLMVMVAASVALALSHHGLSLYAGFLVISALVWAAGGAARGGSWQRFAGIALASVIVAAAISRSSGEGALDALASGQGFDYADQYRKIGMTVEARTTYGLRLDTSSLLGFIVTVPVVYAEYMFAPFPWQVATILDVNGLLESLLRLVLIISSVVTWRRARGLERSQIGLLLWLYFAMELLWALGTVNWGTAIRHHLPAFGLLAVSGGPLIMRTLATGLNRAVHANRTA